MCGPMPEPEIQKREPVPHGWEMMPDEIVRTSDGEIMPAYEAERRHLKERIKELERKQ